VKHRFTALTLLIASSLLVLFSCKKLNESTTLGGGVIPGVDGVHTFDTTLTVEAFNEMFTGTTDSLGVSRFEDHVLGYISNDPLFGRTAATIYMELKPTFYKWTFKDKPDSLTLDSVVLVMAYIDTYGDTTIRQRANVYEIDNNANFKPDSNYLVREDPFTSPNFLGSKEYFPSELNDSIRVSDDTLGTHQLRIRLDDAFGNRLLDYDSSTVYATDSAFKTNFRGFAIRPDEGFGGNAISAFALAGCRLAIYYKFKHNGVDSTTVDYFTFTGSSAEHNYVRRDYAGTPILAAQGGTTPDDLIYLQNSPGSFASLKVPALRNMTNRVVHRAELIVEQVYDISDKTFRHPQALFLDVFDSTLMKHKTIPYDFVPNQDGSYLAFFGMYGFNSFDASSNIVKRWTFNISRYVQNILTKKEPLHNFRLVAHRYLFDEIRGSAFNNTGNYGTIQVPINPIMAYGRVRVGGTNHPTQRMRVRIIYSKI
jgi:hypothetical protein